MAPSTALGADTQMLVVLSHMRSYSTLLVHLLSSAVELEGRKELHRSYASMAEVRAVRESVAQPPATAALDNLLHGRHELSAEVRSSSQMRWIISLREPLTTLNSMWRWGGGKGHPYRQPGVAADYYVQRMQELADIAPTLGAGFIHLRSDELVGDSKLTLSSLTAELGLSRPLDRRYATDDTTGNPGSGDFSRWIRRGRIVKRRRYKLKAEVDPRDVERASDAHQAASERLAACAAVTI